MPSATTLFDAYNTRIPPRESSDITSFLDIFSNSVNLSDALFFIQFTPDNTMRCRWYLIQVYLDSTITMNKDHAVNRKYWYIFLSRHPDDRKKQ